MKPAVARAVRLVVWAVLLPGTIVVLAETRFGAYDPSELAQFLVAMVLVGFLDVILPHGDTVDVDAPLIVASMYLYGPGVALAMIVVTRIIVHVANVGIGAPVALATALTKRLAGVLATAVVSSLLGVESIGQLGPYTGVLGLGAVFIAVQLVIGQLDLVVERNESLLRALIGSILIRGPVLAASASIAVLAVLVHDGMGAWGLVVVLFLIASMRQSFALLLDVRQAYQVTIETLVGAMEIQSPDDKGQVQCTARLVRTAGWEMGWFGRRVERMGYAALLAHYGLSFHRRHEDTAELLPTPIMDVEFLRPAEPILKLLRDETDFGSCRRSDLLAAYLVSKAFGHVQGYQTQAAARIAQALGSRELRRADNAFDRALTRAARP